MLIERPLRTSWRKTPRPLEPEPVEMLDERWDNEEVGDIDDMSDLADQLKQEEKY